ncbi:MAG: isochorismatase family cysteine hydrolase [Dongiaceae bacterium]
MERYVDAQSYPFPYNGDLRPENTAFLVIDMQVDFCGYNGWCDLLGVDMDLMRSPIKGAVKVLEAARRKNYPVIYTREGHRPDGSDLTEVKRFRSRRMGPGIGDDGKLGRNLVRGEPGWEIIPELTPHKGDPIVDKAGSGAFYATELEHMLRRRKIQNLVIFGVTTEVCVNTTLREASDRGFDNLLLEDCCAATVPALHKAAVEIVRSPDSIFGTVSVSEKLIAAIQ